MTSNGGRFRRGSTPTDATALIDLRDLRTEIARDEPSRSLVVVFCGLLFLFPSEVVVAGPLRSNGSPTRLVGFLALFLLFLGVLTVRARRTAQQPSTNPIVVLLLLFLAQALFIYGLNAGRTLSEGQAAAALRAFLIITAGCGIGLFITQSVRTLRHSNVVIGTLLAGSVLNSLIGLSQAAGVRFTWAEVMLLPGFAFTAPPGTLSFREGFVRVLGTTSHPIEFAVCLAVSIPLGLHMSRFARTMRGRTAARIATALILLALPFALSRSGVICILIAVLVYLPFATGSQRATLLVAAITAPALAVVLAPQIVDAFGALFSAISLSDSTDNNITGRTDDYPLVDAVFQESPLVGSGSTEVAGLVLDNQWLSFLVSGGLVAVIAYLCLFAVPIWFNVRSARRRPLSIGRKSLAGALTAGLAASAFSSLTLDTLFFQQSMMMIFLLVGLSSVTYREAVSPTEMDIKFARHRA